MQERLLEISSNLAETVADNADLLSSDMDVGDKLTISAALFAGWLGSLLFASRAQEGTLLRTHEKAIAYATAATVTLINVVANKELWP